MLRSGILFAAFIISGVAIAEPGGFTFDINGAQEPYPAACIESIYYVARDEVESENVIFNLTDECGKRLYKVTRQNIGKSLSIYYKDNLLSSAMIASALNNNFRLSSKEMPRVILMQLLNDHGAKHG
ncbi:hypothetical protein AFL22_00405 [Pantoea sp. CFSAN033090]|nr:hypothetical protein AFL22_00405 [Pantoea sp. CFSAN033090]